MKQPYIGDTEWLRQFWHEPNQNEPQRSQFLQVTCLSRWESSMSSLPSTPLGLIRRIDSHIREQHADGYACCTKVDITMKAAKDFAKTNEHQQTSMKHNETIWCTQLVIALRSLKVLNECRWRCFHTMFRDVHAFYWFNWFNFRRLCRKMRLSQLNSMPGNPSVLLEPLGNFWRSRLDSTERKKAPNKR